MKRSRLLASVLATGNLRYQARVKNLFGSSLIAYWPLWEASGLVAEDISGNGRNGAIAGAGVTYGVAGIGDGKTGLTLDGVAGFINAYTAGLSAAFTGDEHTIFMWSKNTNWNSASNGYLGTFANGAVDSWTYIQKNGTEIDFNHTAGGVSKYSYAAWLNTTAWVLIAVSVSKSGDYIRAYINGVLNCSSQTVTGIGAWSGNTLNAGYANLGANGSAPQNPYPGGLAHAGIINRAITAEEHNQLYRMLRGGVRLAFLGDSITAWGGENWASIVAGTHNSGYCQPMNHAAGSNSIIAHMDAQTVAAASDGADIIIVALGTNDNPAGDMNALQAEYAENLAELKTSNPGAAIYAMNVLPRWTDNTGAVENDYTAVRAAIAAACAAQSVTCWDTHTTPWITAADTSDGVHPTAAGHAKIATQVLARL